VTDVSKRQLPAGIDREARVFDRPKRRELVTDHRKKGTAVVDDEEPARRVDGELATRRI
jgi:hypothetical protein